MYRDDLEFQIAQYADGTLPADQRAALEAVLAADEGARAMLDAYRKLDAALADDRAARPVAVRWDRLAERISSSVAEHANAVQAVPEELEYAIAGYADGSLTADEREAVEAELSANAAGRLLLADYATVDAALKTKTGPLPAVRWDRLQASISDAIARHDDASAAGDLPEELEFRIAQYADGTLDEAEREAVEAALAEQPAARLLLAEYDALATTLNVAKRATLPAVRWDRLAEEISAAVAREAESEQAEVAGRIEPAERAESYPIFGWLRSPMRLALAASVLLVVSIGVAVLRPKGGGEKVTVPIAQGPVVKIVEGPLAEAAKGEAVEVITIGPPPDRAEFATGFTDDMISRPSRSYVASGARPARPETADDDVALSPWAQ
jgi:anti-sigma factor RsiW